MSSPGQIKKKKSNGKEIDARLLVVAKVRKVVRTGDGAKWLERRRQPGKVLSLKLWRSVIRGPWGNVVEEDEAISFGNCEAIGILTDNSSSRVVRTRPAGYSGVITKINDERYKQVEGGSIDSPFIDVWKQNQGDT